MAEILETNEDFEGTNNTSFSDDDWDSLFDDLEDKENDGDNDTEKEVEAEAEAEAVEDEQVLVPEDVSNDTDNVETADQPITNEDVNAEETSVTETSNDTSKVADQHFELKHFDETRDVTLDEMKSMAQKGWDYDRMKEKNETLKAENARLKFFEDFLENIKGDYDSVGELMDDANAELLVKSEADNGRVLSKEDAIKRVKANREALWQDSANKSANTKQSVFEDFAKTFPDLDPKEIPQEVWNEFNVTGDLKGAYRQFKLTELKSQNSKLAEEVRQLKGTIDTLKQNEKNKERSTGSQKTQGNKAIVDDDIFAGWDD